jgi:hypothetical protein
MLPDKMKAVLRDFRAKKATSASELAKLHGVSRSAVYRLLKKETGESSNEKPTEPEKPQRPERENTEATESTESNDLMDNLFSKAEQFANSLGLPDQAGQIKHEEVKDEKAEQEKEEKLNALMDAMMGETPQVFKMDLPQGLEEAIAPPESRPRKQIPEPMNELVLPQVKPEALRAELTQKIIFNVQHFAPQLEVIIGTNKEAFINSLAQMPTGYLKETLITLERTRSVGNIANGFKHLFYVAGQATETATQFMGMNTRGFTDQLRAQEQEVTMILKEIAIEQWERLKVMDSPQIRLGMIFCMTLIQVDTRNRLEDMFKHSQVPDHIAKSSVDL